MTDNMILLGTIYSLYGRRAGVELYIEKIIDGLLHQYEDIIIYVYCNKEAFNTLNNNNKLIKIYIPYLDNQIKKAYWLEYLSIKRIIKDNIEVFWIPSGTNYFPGKWKIPTVVTFHDFGEFFIKKKYDFIRSIYRKFICVPKSIKRATIITTVSKKTADDFNKLYPKVKAPVIIYSGPSPRSEIDISNNYKEIIKKETGLNFDEIIFTPGRTDYIGKGLDILLEAYKKAKEKLGNIPPLVLAGPKGEEHERFIQSIFNNNLQNSVFWVGRVSDICIEALYKISKIVVIASRYEGFGFPVLESMHYSIPLISSDKGAIPEIAGNAALYYKDENTTQLSENIINLLNNHKLREELIKRGKEQVSKFSWEKTFSSMRDIFYYAKQSES